MVSFVNTALHKLFGIETATYRAEVYNALRIKDNEALKKRMKPDDNIRGFMFDTDKLRGVIVPVDKNKLLEIYKGPKKNTENPLQKDRVRFCSKAFNDNNDMHLMITVYVNEEGSVRLLEGNHRLELLRQGSEDTILVNVVNNSGYDKQGFNESIKKLIEKCGAPDALIEPHDAVVFCNIDYDGHFPYIYEKRVTAPYYTIDQGYALTNQPSQSPENPQP